jgi:hypothetical protein
MYKTQSGGLGLQDRKKAKLITVMAVVILSIFILVGCSNPSGGPPGGGPIVNGIAIMGNDGSAMAKNSNRQLDLYDTWTEGKAATPTAFNPVVWTITSAKHIGTTITAGNLHVSSAETNGSLTVKAEAGGFSTTTQVTVDTTKEEYVSSITISASTNSILNNGSDSITLTVTNVVGSTDPIPSDSVTWSVSSGINTEVTFSSNPDTSTMLTVGTNGVPGIIKVIGTSVVTPGIISNEVTITIVDAIEKDFKIVANANLLGLFPGSDYGNGLDVISDMDARVQTSFYDPTPNPANPINGININSGNVAGAAPAMTWVFKGDNLMVYGEAGNATIVFNIAVINEITGQGWITGDYNNSPYGNTYKRTYSTGFEEISISKLTGGSITTTSVLNDYKVYVIVRNQAGIHDGDEYDFNKIAYKTQNVISVTIP